MNNTSWTCEKCGHVNFICDWRCTNCGITYSESQKLYKEKVNKL